jgi:hypothetical protein
MSALGTEGTTAFAYCMNCTCILWPNEQGEKEKTSDIHFVCAAEP